MGRFQLVTTSTMDRGSSTFSGLETVRSLWAKETRKLTWDFNPPDGHTFVLGCSLPREHPPPPCSSSRQHPVGDGAPQPSPPFQVILLLGEASPRQRGRGLGQKAHKIVAEVEGDSALIGSQPPAGKEPGRERHHAQAPA